MILGAITNTWRDQLATTSLPQLVERARRRGAAHIELRQTCLGAYEYGAEEDWRPETEKLSRLMRMFPSMTFNLAIAYPCLSKAHDPESGLFQRALDVAQDIAGLAAPSLRLVDPARFESAWEAPEDIPETALGVKELVQTAAGRRIQLFIENAGQPIRSMGILVKWVRESLAPENAAYLGLCVDPINSLRADPGSDPISEIEALPLDYLSMVHFKQMVDGAPHPTVDDGDLDYPKLLDMLRSKGYEGAALLEIPPCEDAFDNFTESMKYLDPLLG